MVELGGGGGPPGPPPRIYATEYRNLFLKILDLGNTLVVEIQKGIVEICLLNIKMQRTIPIH
jgi:hypothetical protein